MITLATLNFNLELSVKIEIICHVHIEVEHLVQLACYLDAFLRNSTQSLALQHKNKSRRSVLALALSWKSQSGVVIANIHIWYILNFYLVGFFAFNCKLDVVLYWKSLGALNFSNIGHRMFWRITNLNGFGEALAESTRKQDGISLL